MAQLLTEEERLRLLAPPTGRLPVVLDTDTFNEIDDQFALVYALLSPERLSVEAIYAAPFHNSRSSGPGDGMERSYEEIGRLLDRLGRQAEGLVHKGSAAWLPAPDRPVPSAAADDLIARARLARGGPLYVIAIGAITTIASAILAAPDIVGRIVVVWLGGHPTYWHHTREFNLSQDLHAARVVFDSGVPLIHVPCQNVAQQVRTTQAELERHIKGRGPVGDYLYAIFTAYYPDHFARSKEIWDLAAVAYLINPGWTESALVHSPILTAGETWSADPRRHLVRELLALDRDEIFRDLFNKLEAESSPPRDGADAR